MHLFMTSQEFKHLLAFDKAKRHAPLYSAIPKAKAKAMRFNVSKSKGKKVFVISKDQLPWAF